MCFDNLVQASLLCSLLINFVNLIIEMSGVALPWLLCCTFYVLLLDFVYCVLLILYFLGRIEISVGYCYYALMVVLVDYTEFASVVWGDLVVSVSGMSLIYIVAYLLIGGELWFRVDGSAALADLALVVLYVLVCFRGLGGYGCRTCDFNSLWCSFGRFEFGTYYVYFYYLLPMVDCCIPWKGECCGWLMLLHFEYVQSGFTLIYSLRNVLIPVGLHDITIAVGSCKARWVVDLTYNIYCMNCNSAIFTRICCVVLHMLFGYFYTTSAEFDVRMFFWALEIVYGCKSFRYTPSILVFCVIGFTACNLMVGCCNSHEWIFLCAFLFGELMYLNGVVYGLLVVIACYKTFNCGWQAFLINLLLYYYDELL
eukprot:gene2883-1865_t